MNKITISGKLNYFKVRTAKNDMRFATFSINNQESVGRGNKFCNIQCVLFSRDIDNISLMFKDGDTVSIEGMLNDNNYNKADGTKVYNKQITVSKIEMVSPATDEISTSQDTDKISRHESSSTDTSLDIRSDDLPF